ncbi:MAG: peptide ABC transporter substrate-binding protein [Magnetospirillum sp.]|nr:peptide ABC transporter substrate-binding protein [Magnetospirillum sp.]
MPRQLSFLAVAVCLLAAAMAAPVRAEAKDTLVIGVTQFPATFHPAIESMLAKSYVLAMARRPLTAYDPDWNLVCLLCTRLPTIDNGLARPETLPDGRRGIAVTYTLRADAEWGDGVPVDTGDVLFSWQVGRHPQTGVADAEIYRHIVAIDIKNEKTFTFHFDRLAFDYNAVNDFQILPAHIERDRFERAPAEYRNRTAYDRDTANPGLWNGPYRIARVVQGSAVVLERNSHWHGRRPAFDRIVVVAIENTSALQANLLAGSIDMIAGELGLPLEQAIAFAKNHGDRFRVVFKPSLVYEHIDLNLDNPYLADRRVRQALLLALDRATLCGQLFGGRQKVADGPVAPLDPMHSDDVRQYPYDPAAAGALLDEAGYPLVNGRRVGPDGRPLTLDLVTTAGNRSRELVAQVLQADWKRIGIPVRLRYQPPRVFFGQTVTRRKFPAMAMFAWYSAPANVPRGQLRSSMIPTAGNNWSGQNYGGYANPRMDALLDAIEVELDPAERQSLWRALQALYADDLPALPLYYKADAHIWPKSLKGVTPTGQEDPSTLWVEDWRWE